MEARLVLWFVPQPAALGGRALNTRGATALSRRPLPIPAGLSRRESLLACQGSTGAGGESGTGGVDAQVPPPG